jgi:phosphoribosylglycinamide formyltransferase 1
MKSYVCLISGRGSNLEAILRCASDEQWQRTIPARCAAVISSRADAAGLAVAQRYGVPAQVVAQQVHPARDSFDAALVAAIEPHRPDVVVLAGFMRVLTDRFVARFADRLINIHPSLLPAFPGLATHRQALAAGVRWHGATVHYVSSTVDAGPIIAQTVVPVLEGDSEETLADRVLVREHEMLPRALRWCLEGRVSRQGERVVVREMAGSDRALMAA